MFRAEYSLAISCWQQLVEDGFQMFAVIEDGNRQHRVQEGSFLSVDYRGTEVQAGASITFDRVLLANGGGASIVGAPTISFSASCPTRANSGRERFVCQSSLSASEVEHSIAAEEDSPEPTGTSDSKYASKPTPAV